MIKEIFYVPLESLTLRTPNISLDVDVVHATSAKDMNQPNHGDNSVYRRLSESTSGTVRCALTFETATVETVDVAAVTPPQQKKKTQPRDRR